MKRGKGRLSSVTTSRAVHDFAMAPQAAVQRSVFNRTHGVKTTFNFGQIIPILVDEILPGDIFHVDLTSFARLATPLVPVMDNMYLDVHFFVVPCRLLWQNWEPFMGYNSTPLSGVVQPTYTIPVISANSGTTGSLWDYFGLPTGVSLINPISALPFRAYTLIYNQWYRDENLQNEVALSTLNGPDTVTNTAVLTRNKRRDYFTSALPWPQKGAAVSLPLGSTAPVLSTGIPLYFAANGTTTTPTNSLNALSNSYNVGWQYIVGSGNQQMGLGYAGAVVNALQVDLSAATAATINQIRLAFQLQKLLERDARGGTRYTEVIQAHFGVVSPDARMQRAEFLGGGTVAINVSPVAQTSGTGSTGQTTPQGNLAAIGTASLNRCGFTKAFSEHCYLMALVSARADLNYQQGVNRLWIRQTRYDFYWPVFSHIGEQVVYNGELYAQGTIADAGVFGYQEAWAEYRYKPSLITGLFRSNVTAGYTSLQQWHLAQNFGSLPALNSTFMAENPPVTRVLATQDNLSAQILFDGYFRMKCTRPMPVYSVPGYIDHF